MLRSLVIVPAALCLAACVTDRGSNELSESATKGRALARANCAGCHALDDGVSPSANAPSLRRAAHRLPDWMVAGSFRRGIQVGHTMEMPVFEFEEEDIDNLLAYFEVLKARELEDAG